jgi:hypothetical protein
LRYCRPGRRTISQVAAFCCFVSWFESLFDLIVSV